MPNVTIYTDGSCLKNPGGNGGWAAVIKRDGEETRLCGGLARTTNNRMEITALLEALRSLDEACVVTVVTDSQYVSNSISKGWLAGWAKKGWKDKEGKTRLNADLWKLLLEQLQRHRVTMHWIRGHAGHRENEICDKLARKAAEGPNLPVDEGYADMLAQEREAASASRAGSAAGSRFSWMHWEPSARTPSRTPAKTAGKAPSETSPKSFSETSTETSAKDSSSSPVLVRSSAGRAKDAESPRRSPEKSPEQEPKARGTTRKRSAGAGMVQGSLEAMLAKKDD